MSCPNCKSTSVFGPQYAISMHGRSAIMSCRACGERFDAYALFGAATLDKTYEYLAIAS